jgi:hypothetical protein
LDGIDPLALLRQQRRVDCRDWTTARPWPVVDVPVCGSSLRGDVRPDTPASLAGFVDVIDRSVRRPRRGSYTNSAVPPCLRNRIRLSHSVAELRLEHLRFADAGNGEVLLGWRIGLVFFTPQGSVTVNFLCCAVDKDNLALLAIGCLLGLGVGHACAAREQAAQRDDSKRKKPTRRKKRAMVSHSKLLINNCLIPHGCTLARTGHAVNCAPGILNRQNGLLASSRRRQARRARPIWRPDVPAYGEQSASRPTSRRITLPGRWVGPPGRKMC